MPERLTAALPGRTDDEASAARGFAFTAGLLLVLFAAAAIGRLGWGGLPSRTNASAMVWPTTWQFYANSAHQEFVVVHRFDEDTNTFHPLTSPIADVRNRWGLGHSAYADLARLRSTAEAIPRSAWRPCAAQAVAACSAVIAASPRVTVTSSWASLSGPVVFAVERPTGRQEGWSRRVELVAVVDLVYSG